MTQTKTRWKPTIVGIALVAALAGLLFGFDVGVISGAMLFIQKNYAISPAVEGMIVGAVPLGALVAAALCGRFNDLMGRRNNLLFTAFLFIFGTLSCAFAGSPVQLMLARFVVGIAIGVGSFSAPLYIAEVADESSRGGLVTLNQLAIVTGILLAFLIDYLFASQGAWRLMFACGLIPATILFFLAWLLPESPRWLMTRGRTARAEKILVQIHGAQKARKEFVELQKVVQLEHSVQQKKWHEGFFKVLALGIFVSILTQAVGINAIIYYAPSIFQLNGMSSATSAILATVGVGAVNFIFTCFAVRFLDAFGRRRMLLVGVAGIVLSLIAIVFSFAHDVNGNTQYAMLTFIAVIVFIACQAIGTGPACWLIPSEIFPINMRGLGMGLSVAFNWGTNVVVAMLFPVILKACGGTVSFAVFLVIAIIAWIYFYFFLPETKGVSLEKIEENLYSGKRTRDLGE